MKITKSDFQSQMKAPVDTKDAGTLQRLKDAGVDGKKLLEDADIDQDGKVAGAGEVDKLFTGIDAHDKDGSRNSVTGAKPRAIISALKAPAEPSTEGAAGSTADIYAADAGPLARGTISPEVKDAQKLLQKAGYELPRYGADGNFGGETERAVKAFQGDNKLEKTGKLDDVTLQKLKDAKPAAAVQFPEYDKMFKDGVMQTTLGVGFDEDGHDIAARQAILGGLQERGFQKLDVKNLSDDQLKQRGFDPKSIDRNATYFTKPFQHDGKDVKALVKLIDRDSPNAKGQFSEGMKKDDLVLYSGHARRGAGPDFDHANSAAGNYVIGKPYEDGHYALGANDLNKQGALSKDYQLMLFSGCRTTLYLDDVRKVKGNDKLDVVASTRELHWGSGDRNALLMLDGVMGGKSIQDIKSRLETDNVHPKYQGDAFVADGFKRNTYRPGASPR